MSTTDRRESALVIGAGPSGLVAAKYLLESVNPRYDVTILEQQELPSSSSTPSTTSSSTLLSSTYPAPGSEPRKLGNAIGGTFVNKVYDGTRLVSSKYITAFSDFRMVSINQDNSGSNGYISDNSTDSDHDSIDMKCIDKDGRNSYPIEHTNHPSAEEYVRYLEEYCRRFNIMDCIKFGCRVVSLKEKNTNAEDESSNTSLDSNGYMVQYESKNYEEKDASELENPTSNIITEHYDVVAVCSGLHNIPTIPKNIPSMRKSFLGDIIHSSEYKDSSMFDNKRVLILGSGETAMDIALRAISNPSSVSVGLNVRRGFLSIPHNLAEDRPLDVFITNLFEHSYEHPWVQALGLRWILSTVVIRLFLFLTGSSVGFNQWACETTPIRRGYHIINKSHGAMAHLNVPVKSRSFWGRFWMRVYGEVGLRPIESFHRTSVDGIQEDGRTVIFEDGRTYEADIIVLATGYKQLFHFLDDAIREDHKSEAEVGSRLEKDAKMGMDPSSRFVLEEDYLPSEHFITSKKRPRLGFIGFVRPNVGAIPPMSELQVMWWLCRMHGKVNMLASAPRSYMVLGSKYPYGVDYGNYMHRIAEDIGAAPTLSCLFRCSRPFRALFTYCMGQSHIPLFRLQGPFAKEICWKVVTGELWDVCVRRGIVENFGLVAVCWLSLLINLAACVLEMIWCLLTIKRPLFFTRY